MGGTKASRPPLACAFALTAVLLALGGCVSDPGSGQPSDQVAGGAPSAGGSGHSSATDTGATPASEPTPHFGYQFEPYHISRPLAVCVNPDGGPPLERPLVDVVRDALAHWQDAASGRIPLSVSGLCPGTRLDPRDGVSVVAWAQLKGTTVGRAQVRQAWGAVVEADIALGGSWGLASDDSCLLAVVLHEVGHVVGLDHQGNGPSIMAPRTSCNPVLSAEDIAAVRFLYPPAPDLPTD